MYPTLFPSDNITASLGLGKLTETLSCIVSEEVNGDYSLELRYPIKGERYEALLNGGTIQVISPTYVSGNATPRMNRQWFDIYKHSIPIDGVVTFYANHVSRRLTMGVFHGTQVDGNHIAYVWGTDASPSAPYNGMDFLFSSRTNPASGYVMDEPDTKSPMAVLIGGENSLVSNYGGEFAFNCDPNVVMRCNVYYIDRRGANRGVEIRHGFNLTDLEKTKDYSGTYNAVVPYWEDSDGNRVFANGFLVQSDPPQTPVRAVPLNCSSWYDTQPTSEQLISTAQNHLANHTPWVEAETLTVDFINGAEIDPHGADIALGDTVHVYWQDGRVDALLRVMSYKYDVLAERYSELKLGTQQTQFVAVTGAESYSGATGGGSSGGGLPSGGTQGQALFKNSSADGDAIWSDLPKPMMLLWTFDGNTFAAQTVELDLSEYDMVLIRVHAEPRGGAYPNIGDDVFCRVGESRRLICNAQYFHTNASSSSYWLSRLATVTTTGITFSKEYSINITNNARSSNNTFCIPYEIYGIKTGSALEV